MPDSTSTRTRRWLQTALLLILGIYFLDILKSGNIAFYINERFNILALIAGIVFLVFGVISLVTLLQEPAPGDGAPKEIDLAAPRGIPAHTGNKVASWPVLGIMAVPLVLGILIPAKPLGASGISNRGISTSLSSNSSLNNVSTQNFSTAPEQRNILDWVRAFTASESPDEFSGQAVDVIGFVYRDVRFAENTQFMVSRYTVSCCVADAFAIGIVVESDQAKSLSQEAWVHIKGKFAVKTFDGQPTPILVADSIESVSQPDKPYLYP